MSSSVKVNEPSNDDDFTDFCEELRSRTKVVHDESNRLANMKLIVIVTDKRLWAESIAEFYFIFRTLEECMNKHRDHPIIGSINMDPKMYRTQAFERDLEYFLGPDWQVLLKPSNVAETYCNHLFEISDKDPLLLVSYIHSFYFGLLFGGQIVKRIVRKTLGLSGEEGLEMLSFGNSATRFDLKTDMKEKFNDLNLSREEKERIVEEKFVVFRMNKDLLQNIQPSLANYSRLILFSTATFAGIAGIIFILVRYFSR